MHADIYFFLIYRYDNSVNGVNILYNKANIGIYLAFFFTFKSQFKHCFNEKLKKKTRDSFILGAK